MSGFCRLPSPHRPGSSHAIGVSAPFTVWVVVPLLAGNNNNRKKNPYKNNRVPTCWLGPLIRAFSRRFYPKRLTSVTLTAEPTLKGDSQLVRSS